MTVPEPEPGLVISYSYLWRFEKERGEESGRKRRPCVVILAKTVLSGRVIVWVAPVTHQEPGGLNKGIEIPPRVKSHLGLDPERSWVITHEINQFLWPGFDLGMIRKGQEPITRIDYGFLPPKLFEKIRQSVLDHVVARRSLITNRD